MTQQGDRQTALRTLASVSAGTYDENLFAAADAEVSLNGHTVAGAEILLLQHLLDSTNANLNGLRAEYAVATDAANWSSVGTYEDQTA